MWGFLAKAGAWAWAHKQEIASAIQVWKALRARRKANQAPDETAKDYYVRTGKSALVGAVVDITVDGEEPS
jgi:hypothetical protein